jgi:hypothetical protein
MSIINFINATQFNSPGSESIFLFELFRLLLPFIIVWFFYIIFVIVIWLKSESLSKKIIANDFIENVSITLSYGHLVPLGIIIVGIYLFIDSLPRLFSYISSLIIDRSRFVDKSFQNEYTIKEIIEIIGIILKIITSLSIIKYKDKITDKLIIKSKSNFV